MKKIRFIKQMTFLFFVFCLLGINYAWHTDNLIIFSNISTGGMEYSFDQGGKSLTVLLDSAAANELLKLERGASYQLSYTLKKDDRNSIALKSIQHEYMGNIAVNLNSVTCSYQGAPLTPSAVIQSLIPGSLGSFECYNDFQGCYGTITLIKTSDPTETNNRISVEELDSELQAQLKADYTARLPKENNECVEILDETNQEVNEKAVGKDKEDNDKDKEIKDKEEKDKEDKDKEDKGEEEKDKEDKDKEDKDKEGKDKEEKDKEDKDKEDKDKDDKDKDDKDKEDKPDEEEPVVLAALSLEGTYSFEVPLHFDQYNQ
jgi:hypothetical protein